MAYVHGGILLLIRRQKGKGIGGGFKIEFFEGVMNPREQTEFAAHIAEAREMLHLTWQCSNFIEEELLQFGEWLHEFI